ncbi:hypothetical protein ACQJBY_073613 [Aegilops geniculata]
MARRSSNSWSSSRALPVVVLAALLICCPMPCSAGIRSGVYYRYGPPSPQGGRPVHAGCPWCGPAAPQPPTPVVATAQDRSAAADQQGRGRRLLSAE